MSEAIVHSVKQDTGTLRFT